MLKENDSKSTKIVRVLWSERACLRRRVRGKVEMRQSGNSKIHGTYVLYNKTFGQQRRPRCNKSKLTISLGDSKLVINRFVIECIASLRTAVNSPVIYVCEQLKQTVYCHVSFISFF